MPIPASNLPLIYVNTPRNKTVDPDTDKSQKWERELKKALNFVCRDYVGNFLSIYYIAKSKGLAVPDWELDKMTVREIFEKEFNTMFKGYSAQKYVGLQEQDITFKKEIIPFTIEVRGKYKTSISPVDLEVMLSTSWKEANLVPKVLFQRASNDTDVICMTNMLNLAVLGVKMDLLAEGLSNNFNWNYKDVKGGFRGDAVFEHRRFEGENIKNYSVPAKIDVVKSGERVKFTAYFKGLTWR